MSNSEEHTHAVYEAPEIEPPNTETHVERAAVGVVGGYCTRPFGTECQRCAIACPHQAISFNSNNRPAIDANKCTDCGLCIGICDAFCSERITYHDFLEKVREASQHNTPVYFTCAEHVFPDEKPAHNVMVLPCIGAVAPEFWTVLLHEGIEVIIQVDFEFCDTCFCAGNAAPLFSHAIKLAEDWTGVSTQSCATYPLEGTFWDSFVGAEDSDRRGIVTSVASGGMSIATGDYRKRNANALNSFDEQRERMRARGFLNSDKGIGLSALTQGVPRKHQHPRYEELVKSVKNHPEGASRILRWFVLTNPHKCQQCLDCIDSCPTGARYYEEDTAPYTLTDVSRCIACGACMYACEHDACDFIEGSAQWFIEPDDTTETEETNSDAHAK